MINAQHKNLKKYMVILRSKNKITDFFGDFSVGMSYKLEKKAE